MTVQKNGLSDFHEILVGVVNAHFGKTSWQPVKSDLIDFYELCSLTSIVSNATYFKNLGSYFCFDLFLTNKQTSLQTKRFYDILKDGPL